VRVAGTLFQIAGSHPTAGSGTVAGMSFKSLFVVLVLVAAAARADETPLTSLPYTPSLDASAMNRSVDPCADFFEYSCGGWTRANRIPPDQSSWEVYAKLYDENQRFLWGILKTAAESRSRSTEEQKIGDYFAACMDEAAVNRAGAGPLRDDLATIDGMKSIAELGTQLGRLHLTMTSAGMLFGSGSDQDRKDSSRVVIYVYAGGLGLPDRDYYVKEDDSSKEIREKYRAHLRTMFGLLGESPDRAAAHEETGMGIETALARASLTR